MSRVKTRPSVWQIASWMVMLLATINAVRVLRDPDALHFFGFWLAVLIAIAAAGSLVALSIVGVRKRSASSQDAPPRII